MDAQKIQRYRHNLVMSGTALILFGVWDVVNAVTSLLYESTDVKRLFDSLDPEMLSFAKTFTIIFVILILLINLWLRLVIGLRVISEGKGTRGNHRYFVLCFILSSIYLVNILYDIYLLMRKNLLVGNILGLFSNVISLFIFIQILISTFWIRRHEKELKTVTKG